MGEVRKRSEQVGEQTGRGRRARGEVRERSEKAEKRPGRGRRAMGEVRKSAGDDHFGGRRICTGFSACKKRTHCQD